MTELAEARPETTTRVGTTGRYLYAVCRGLDVRALDGAVGLAGRPVEFVHEDQLTAVVSSVPLEAFADEALRRGLEDVAWLEETVATHEEVVDALAAVAATVPVRLATVHADDDAVRERLRDQRIPLGCALDRVEGCAEWRVKVVSSRADAESEARTGSLHDALCQLAVAHRELGAEDARLSGHHGVTTLNAAYLVPREASDAFADRLADLSGAGSGAGLVVDVRGPRPAYAFAMLDER